jgi:hypothetical protein
LVRASGHAPAPCNHAAHRGELNAHSSKSLGSKINNANATRPLPLHQTRDDSFSTMLWNRNLMLRSREVAASPDSDYECAVRVGQPFVWRHRAMTLLLDSHSGYER